LSADRHYSVSRVGCEFSAQVTSYCDDSRWATRIRVELIPRSWASGRPTGNGLRGDRSTDHGQQHHASSKPTSGPG